RRGDNRYNDFRLSHGSFVGGEFNGAGERKARQKQHVFPGGGDLLRFFHAVRPERHLVAPAPVQRKRDGGSPGTIAKHDDAAHAALGAPMRLSVPESNRRMFWWCLEIMSRDTAICTATKKGGL